MPWRQAPFVGWTFKTSASSVPRAPCEPTEVASMARRSGGRACRDQHCRHCGLSSGLGIIKIQSSWPGGRACRDPGSNSQRVRLSQDWGAVCGDRGRRDRVLLWPDSSAISLISCLSSGPHRCVSSLYPAPSGDPLRWSSLSNTGPRDCSGGRACRDLRRQRQGESGRNGSVRYTYWCPISFGPDASLARVSRETSMRCCR